MLPPPIVMATLCGALLVDALVQPFGEEAPLDREVFRSFAVLVGVHVDVVVDAPSSVQWSTIMSDTGPMM